MSSRTRSPGFSLEATPIGEHRGREASALTHFVGRRPLNLLEPLRRFPPPAEMREGELAGLADGRSESWIAMMDANGYFNGEITHSSPQHLPTPPPTTPRGGQDVLHTPLCFGNEAGKPSVQPVTFVQAAGR